MNKESKFIRFKYENRICYGFIKDEEVIDLSTYYRSAEDLLSAWHRGAIDLGENPSIPAAQIEKISFLPPTASGRNFCVGRNYMSHRQELESKDSLDEKVPVNPSIFLRNKESLVGHKCELFKSPATHCYDFEGELAAVIGIEGKANSENQALELIAGYTCFMDGSARDFQEDSIGAGKNFDCSGAIGPWVASKREIENPQTLTIETRLNGKIMQQASTSEMIASVVDIVIYLSKFTTLKPGDVIATGTPAGVGMSRNPPIWLVSGDMIEVSISSVGCLTNLIV